MMKTYKLLIKMSSLLMLTSLLIGCNNDEPVTLNDFGPELEKTVMSEVNYPLQLKGFAYFPAFAVKEKREIVSWDASERPCDATLYWISDKNYRLEIVAYATGRNEYINIDLKITPSGVISFMWPETFDIHFTGPDIWITVDDIVGAIQSHHGTVIYGPGLNKDTFKFNGKFDGLNFYASNHNTEFQIEFGDGISYAWTEEALGELIEGPIKTEMATLVLEVVDD